MRRVSMPQIVEADAGKPDPGEYPHPFMCDAVWLERTAIGLGHHPRVI